MLQYQINLSFIFSENEILYKPASTDNFFAKRLHLVLKNSKNRRIVFCCSLLARTAAKL